MLKEREGRGEKKNETKINAEKGITLPTRFKTFLIALTFEKFDLLWFVRLPNRYNKITIEFSALNFVKYFLFPRFDSNSTANFSRSINHKFGGGDDFGEMFVHANEYTRSLALILGPLSMKVIWQRVKLNVGASADLFERMTEIYVGGAQNFTPAPSIRDPRFRRLVPLIGNSTFRRWEITNLIENLWLINFQNSNIQNFNNFINNQFYPNFRRARELFLSLSILKVSSSKKIRRKTRASIFPPGRPSSKTLETKTLQQRWRTAII